MYCSSENTSVNVQWWIHGVWPGWVRYYNVIAMTACTGSWSILMQFNPQTVKLVHLLLMLIVPTMKDLINALYRRWGNTDICLDLPMPTLKAIDAEHHHNSHKRCWSWGWKDSSLHPLCLPLLMVWSFFSFLCAFCYLNYTSLWVTQREVYILPWNTLSNYRNKWSVENTFKAHSKS